jgi:hypothetical protein
MVVFSSETRTRTYDIKISLYFAKILILPAQALFRHNSSAAIWISVTLEEGLYDVEINKGLVMYSEKPPNIFIKITVWMKTHPIPDILRMPIKCT